MAMTGSDNCLSFGIANIKDLRVIQAMVMLFNRFVCDLWIPKWEQSTVKGNLDRWTQYSIDRHDQAPDGIDNISIHILCLLFYGT